MNDEKGKAMSISDEIREWCNLPQAYGIPCDELRGLADRIDREMIESPKDRDGMPIHEGDKPIVRCKECVWGKAVEQIGCIRFEDRGSDGLKDPDGFCAWGEKRED